MIKLVILKFTAFLFGFSLCFSMHSALSVPVVLAAAFTGLIGSLLPFTDTLKRHLASTIYAGSFAGMCSASLITSYWEIVIISLIGASLYLLSINMFTGFGGRLGSLAFTSVAIFVLARGIIL